MNLSTRKKDQTIAVRVTDDMLQLVRDYKVRTCADSDAAVVRYIINRFFLEASQHEIDKEATE